MSGIDTGDTAFPVTEAHGGNYPHTGMTLRDYFAGQYVIGLCHFWVETRKQVNIEDPKPETVADMAYILADAMIKRRGLASQPDSQELEKAQQRANDQRLANDIERTK